MNRLFYVIFAYILLFACGEQKTIFRFTAIPDQDTSRLEERFDKIADYLSKEFNMEVEYVPVKSYSASIEAFKNNQVQLAWFGGLSGVKARLGVPGSRAIAQGENDPNFYSYFIAHKNAGIPTSDKFPTLIKGKTFTFGSKGSTSGRLMPEYYIRQEFNQSPEDVFVRVGYSGDHSKTIQLVQSGAYQVGAVNHKVWDRKLLEGEIDTGKVSVVWKTPPYPDYNWTIRGDVNKKYGTGFLEKVQLTLIELDDENILGQFPRKSFIKADNAMFIPVFKTAQEVGIIRK